jgi:hypothetical protein
MSPEVHRALRNTEALTRILADRDDDLVKLLQDGTDVATALDRFLLANRANLTCLIRDVRTVNHAVQGQTLDNLDRAFAINQQFFGLIDTLAVKGHAKDIGWGGGERDDQLWLRSRLLVPPQSPSAISYSPPRKPRPVITGAACNNEYGSGAKATPKPGRDLGKRPGIPPEGTSPTIASPLAGATADLGDALPVGQASAPKPSNHDVVPLFILGVGLVVVAATSFPTARTRRRNR